jgi:cytochrome c biogenesis protein ResB
LGVTLLALLAVAAIAGTFIESAKDTATAQRLVYHAPWFSALMALIILNLGFSTWQTLLRVLRLPRERGLLRRPDDFKRLREVREISGPVNDVRMQAALRRHLGAVVAEPRVAFAQRGIIQRWGAVITHTGIILLLGGSIFLSLRAHFGGPGGGMMVWIGEGMTRDWYLAPDAENPRMSRRTPLPFQVRLHDFDADNFPNTQIPRAFTSTIELVAPNGVHSFHRVNMTKALRWEGWKLSQASFAVLDNRMEDSMARFLRSLDMGAFNAAARQGRLTIQLVDTRTQRRLPPFDAGLGTRVPVPQSDLMFETADGRTFRLFGGNEVIAQGPLEDGEGHNHGAVDAPTPATAVSDQAWTVLVNELFPNYRRVPEGDSTDGSAMTNPAIRWTLFANGAPVGQSLAFNAESFRGMRFGEVPVLAIFESYEPSDLENWEPGDEITLHVNFVKADSQEAIGSLDLQVGEARNLTTVSEPSDAPTSQPTSAPLNATPSVPAMGHHTAAIVGHEPAAYSGLSVMKEFIGLKWFFYISFALFLAGPLIAFLLAHCQVWVWVSQDGKRAMVGGRVRGRRSKLSHILDAIERDLKEALS